MDELKPLLVQLLEKVDAIHTDVAGLKADVTELKTGVAELKTDVAGLKAGQARLEDDNRQIKEMLGAVRMREIARLDGRIDQLTLDVGLGRTRVAE